jgi:putative hydrolase of the HAD superfamily
MFDLDDTIYDHKYHRRCALSALKNAHPQLANISLDELEREHERLLTGDYSKVLDRLQTDDESRLERMRLLFQAYGVALTDNETRVYSDIYQKTYKDNRRAIPGVIRLIDTLRKSVSIGVVSNGLHDMQIEKIRILQIECRIDYLVISGDINARKPEKAIFENALSKGRAKPDEAVFIGDSWENDIVGASGCGMKTIWLNRYDTLCPDSRVTLEIRSYENIDAIIGCIFSNASETEERIH